MGRDLFGRRLGFGLFVFVTAAALTPAVARAQTAPSGSADSPPPAVTPPQVLEHVDAVYPLALLARGIEATVIVTITVERDGSVSNPAIAESGGPEFDEAALSAVRGFRFMPALKNGQAVRARIKMPFHFAPGPHTPADAETPPPVQSDKNKQHSDQIETRPSPGQPPATKKTSQKQGETKPGPRPETPQDINEGVAFPHGISEPGKPIEIHVQGRPNPPRLGGSDFRFDRRVLNAAPHPSAGDMLRVAPGVTVMHPEGDAVAQRIALRGFDADHGQDIAFSAGGIPINQASHLHGQGYADLGGIIPETVRSLRVLEGVYDPRQGDFAVAGSVDYDLAVPDRGRRISLGYGAFNTARVLALWAPENAAQETFGAAVFRTSDGFGDHLRGSLQGAATGQYRAELPGDVVAIVHLSAHAARASLAGVLRRADIQSGAVDFYGAYDDPSVRSQSAAASRAQLGITLEHIADDGTLLSGLVWLSRADFRIRQNFTGYTQRSRTHPEWAGRGDLIEQENHDTSLGGRFLYRGRRAEWLDNRLGTQLFLGADLRAGFIDQAQNLLAAPQNETWDQRVDAEIRKSDIGAWGDFLISASRFARVRAGVRADLLTFDVDDRLGNFIPAFQQQTHIQGFRRTAAGIAWGPRLSAESDPLPWLRVHAAYGQGYRSPQARQLEEGESAPFAKVHSYELGARFSREPSLSLTATLYETRLSYDLAFDAGEGRLERIGPTTRRGAVLYFSAQPSPSFTASLSATYVHATLDAPPPATADNPTPPYTSGQQLPFVPPLTLRTDVAYTRELFALRGETVTLQAGYGATFLSPRPLPYGQFAQPVFLLDASIALRRSFLEIGVDATNLFNAQYADSEYAFVSDFRSRPIPSYLPARHIAAGPPLSVLGHITLHL